MPATWRIFADWESVTGTEHAGTNSDSRSSTSPSLVHRDPSPRGRGSQSTEPDRFVRVRSIPAWAGEPGAAALGAFLGGVHLRVGGGALHTPHRLNQSSGPSPRGRGSRSAGAPWRARHRSIPAWAGEPVAMSCRHDRRMVHPRVGGGANGTRHQALDLCGPSPRGRGSRTRTLSPGTSSWPIPAWAGEPLPSRTRGRNSPVHPRVGGGAPDERPNSSADWGPSPRGRGSRRRCGPRAPGHGSIPAWAGEPDRNGCLTRRSQVHPRVGGGALG